MRHRPLCSICLILFVIYSTIIYVGGAKVVKELRPSSLEQNVADGERIRLSGRVYQKEIKEDYQIIYLKNNSCLYQEQSFQESRLIVYDESKQKVNIGNVVLVEGEVSFYEEARNPGNFDQKLYYQKQDIHASVWASSFEVRGSDYVSTWENNVSHLKERLWQLRSNWKSMLCEKMGTKDGNMLAAMLLGEKSEMDQEVKELYQVNGIGHILAISGLHLSFIGVGMYQILRRLTGSYFVGGIAGILFLICYILMIGPTVSAIRALVMFLFRVGADMVGRNYDSLTALSVAAVIVLIWRPLYLYDGGFWLSFGAVLAAVTVLPLFRKMPLQPLWASLSINLTLLPVQLYYFFEIPLYSTILNLWVIPLMSVIMSLGIVGSVISCFWGQAGGWILYLCKWIFWLYEKSCELALALPGARIVTGQPKLWQVGVYYVVFVGVIVWWKRNARLQELQNSEMEGDKIERSNVEKRRTTAVIKVLALVVGITFLWNSLSNYGKVQITVLDVGQGDSIFIKGPKGHTYLIDGGSSEVKKVGRYRIESFLKSQGVRKLDYVFVTHGDSDHTSGIEEMIERGNVGVEIETIIFPTKEVWDEKIYALAEKAMEYSVKVAIIQAGQTLQEGKLSLTCVAPENTFSGETGNVASLVLGLTYGGFDILFTGDVEGEGENILTETLEKEYGTTKWEVLKVAHHGSKNSSGETFLEVVKPKYAVISAGRDNQYGHPHQETVERLENVGSEIVSTQDAGAVMIYVEKESYAFVSN